MAVALLCAYAGALFWISRRAGRHAAGSAESAGCAFFVNSRASGAVGVALSLIVSCVGASATVGVVGMAFAAGTPAFWWLGAGAAGLTLLAILLAAKVRRSGCYPMPEMTERLLGAGARPLISCVIVIAWTAILAAQFSAATSLLESLTGWPRAACLAAGLVLIVAHTFGGQAAIIRTDRFQFYLLLGGLLLLLAGLTNHNPGWTAGVRLEAVNAHFTHGDLLRMAFVVGGNYLVCPMLFGRMYSATDTAAARRGALLGALGLALCSALIVAIGLAARGIVPAGTASDSVLAAAVENALPSWLGVLVLIALLSAVVSSADSCLVTSSTVLCYDLLKSERPGVGRLCVFALGAAGLGLALLNRSILGSLFLAYDMYVSGVVMPVFVALLLEGRRVRRPAFCLLGIVLGGLMGAAASGGNPNWSYLGMAVSSGLTLLGFAGGNPVRAASSAPSQRQRR